MGVAVFPCGLPACVVGEVWEKKKKGVAVWVAGISGWESVGKKKFNRKVM
jgi:hypothetical protein